MEGKASVTFMGNDLTLLPQEQRPALVFGPSTLVIKGPGSLRAFGAELKILQQLRCTILDQPTIEEVQQQLFLNSATLAGRGLGPARWSIVYVLCHGGEDGTFEQREGVLASATDYFELCAVDGVTVVLANCYSASVFTTRERFETSQTGSEFKKTKPNAHLYPKSAPKAAPKAAPTAKEGFKTVVWCAASENQVAVGAGLLNYLRGETENQNDYEVGQLFEVVITYPYQGAAKSKPKPVYSARPVSLRERRTRTPPQPTRYPPPQRTLYQPTRYSTTHGVCDEIEQLEQALDDLRWR